LRYSLIIVLSIDPCVYNKKVREIAPPDSYLYILEVYVKR